MHPFNDRIEVIQGDPFSFADEDIPILREILSDLLPEKSYSINSEQNICRINQSFVGSIELLSKGVDILPRFENIGMKQVQLMYFFLKLKIYEINELSDFFGTEDFSIQDHIAKKFLKELKEVADKGLPHLYVTKLEDLDVIKGFVNIPETFENICLKRQKPFHCDYEETSLSNPLTKALGAALYKIESLFPEEFIVFGRYFPYCSIAEGKQLVDYCLNDGQFFDYFPVLFWAKAILYELNISFPNEGKISSSFLTNFDMLFQNFCFKAISDFGNIYKDDLSIDPNLFISTPKIIYESDSVNSCDLKWFEPDILYDYDNDQGISDTVLDCKCKDTCFFPNDIYQIQFYSTCLFARKCILIYPKTNANQKNSMLSVDSKFKEVFLKDIYAVYIDLSSDNYENFIANMNCFYHNIAKVMRKTT